MQNKATGLKQNWKMENFKKTIIVSKSENEVYNALTNAITKWWTEMFEGIANQSGQSFTIRFGPAVFKTMQVEELIPNKKIVWLVTDALIDIPELKNKTEWMGTKIVWEISTLNDKTILQLTHFGLTPEVECFSICQKGWNDFTKSLEAFIETGIGQPFTLKTTAKTDI